MSRSTPLNRFHLEALEPRVLLSADGLGGAALAGSKLTSAIAVVQTGPTGTTTGSDFNQLLTANVTQNPRSAAAQIESIFAPASTAGSAAASTVTAPPVNAQAAESAAVIAPVTTLQAQSSAVSAAVPVPSAPVAAGSLSSQLVETLHASQGPPATGSTNLLDAATSQGSGGNGTPIAADTALPTVTWISNSNGFWDVASNWSTGLVPTSTDSVLIDRPGVTVTVSPSPGGAGGRSLPVVG